MKWTGIAGRAGAVVGDRVVDLVAGNPVVEDVGGAQHFIWAAIWRQARSAPSSPECGAHLIGDVIHRRGAKLVDEGEGITGGTHVPGRVELRPG